jgi:hypothetical protein
MGKKKIFDMGRDLHKMSREVLQSTLESDELVMTYEKASQPDLPDPFGLDRKEHSTPPRWLYMADLVVSIIRLHDDPDKGVYIIKNRYGMHGKATMDEVIDIAMNLLKVEFNLNIGFFEDTVSKEIREAIYSILHRHDILPKEERSRTKL